MRGAPHPPHWRGSRGRYTLILHRHQLPQGHGRGTCSAWTDTAQHLPSHEDLLSVGTATWCGSPGHQPHRRPRPPL